MEVECRKGYYGILGVNFCSSDDEIRRAYRKLAILCCGKIHWHLDKWNRTPSLLGLAKEKFQQIQEAYSVLSDRRKRTLYDTGLSDDEDEVEGFSDFLQEMASLVRKEEKTYSIEEVQGMFWEMAKDYEIPEWTTNSCQENKSKYQDYVVHNF